MTAGAPPRWRVVLADDAMDLRMLLGKVLTRDGRFVIVGEAEDGREAIEVVDRERPELLLLDLSMPIMDGLEVLPVVRDRFPDVVTVVLSGFESRQMEAHARRLGAVAYLEKGEAFETLAGTLASLLG